MDKFHVNPKTGSPSLCRATTNRGCPYSGVSEHYASREEARADYERVAEKTEHFIWKTNVPPVKGAVTLFTYDPLDQDVPLAPTYYQISVTDPVMKEFIERMDKAPDGTVIVSEDGKVFQKATINGAYGDDSWKSRSPYDPMLRLEQNSSYHSSNFLWHLKTHGARLELPGKEYYPGVTNMTELRG